MSSIGRTSRGFTLLETVVATSVLLVCLGGVAPLFLAATKANQHGRALTTGTLLASEKLEALRVQPLAVGGSVDQDVTGFVDVHDAEGRTRGIGHQPSGAAYIRRWSVDSLTSRPATFVVRVRVMSSSGETRLVGIRWR